MLFRSSILHERFPEVPRIALTATADQQTRDEIILRLQLENALQFVSSFDRPNIRYQIVEKANGRKQLLDFINAQHSGDAGIVYCLSRKKVEETAEFLNENGISSLPYHAGMEMQTRSRNQARFLREDGIVMCATIAFGMGIDKPDARQSAHRAYRYPCQRRWWRTSRCRLHVKIWLDCGCGFASPCRHDRAGK